MLIVLESNKNQRRKKRMNNTNNEFTVLLVDDEEMVRLAMSTALSHAGFIVLESAQASDALDLYTRHAGSINLVVLDLVLPEMWGDEMLPKLRAIDPRYKSSRLLWVRYKGRRIRRRGGNYKKTRARRKIGAHRTRSPRYLTRSKYPNSPFPSPSFSPTLVPRK